MPVIAPRRASHRTLASLTLGLALATLAPRSLGAAPGPRPTVVVLHHENVLGTSLELKVLENSPGAAPNAEAVALAEVDRLARIFSGYLAESEFSRWQRSDPDQSVALSPELLEVLAASDHWRIATHGAFHPGVESLTRLWRTAAHRNSEPSTESLRAALGDLRRPPWTLDLNAGTARRSPAGHASLNAIAKGYIIDRASAAAAAVPGVEGILLEIGGDLRVRGPLREAIRIADPNQPEDNAPAIGEVLVHQTGLATSGGYHRGVLVAGRWRSHILDPRTGQPTDHVASATVIAPDALTADALSTAFSVMEPDESLRLARTLPGVECHLVLRDGRRLTTEGWPAASPSPSVSVLQSDVKPPGTPAAPASTGTNAPTLELHVSFEINNPGGGRYHRPYVAAWIEDKDGFPVRTLLLWLLQSEKGARWIPDLRRWYKGDQLRRLAEDKDLVATVSSATRNPGTYSVVWDGRDDHGQAVKPGAYTFHLEAAREHGTYQLMKHTFNHGSAPFDAELKGNEEIKGAKLEYRRRTARP